MSKKVDCSFMKFVTTNAEWQKEVQDGGSKVLCIVDAYSASWGPCEMVANHFSGYFYDLGETCGLKFVRAQSDKVDALKEFLNQSDSHFLFYLNGEKVHSIQGCNIPAIHTYIKENAPKNDA